MPTRSLAVAVIAGLAAGASAAPLDRSLLPADPAVTIHVDVEAAAASRLGRYILEHKAAFNLQGLDALKAFGVDAAKDLKGVTVLTARGRAEGVVVVHATAAVDAFWNFLKSEPHAKAMSASGYDLLSWEDGGKKKYGVVRKGKTDADRVAFLADDWGALVAALETADGKGEPKESAAPVAEAPAGTILLVDARQVPAEMRKPGDLGAGALFGGLQSGRLELGEGAGEGGRGGGAEGSGGADAAVALRLNLDYDRPESAADIRQIGEGLIAFARLAARNVPQAEPIMGAARAVKTQADGTRVHLTAQWTFEEAKTALNALADARRNKEKAKD